MIDVDEKRAFSCYLGSGRIQQPAGGIAVKLRMTTVLGILFPWF